MNRWLLSKNQVNSQALLLLLSTGITLTLTPLSTAQKLDNSHPMSQITSVSQLRDVEPTAWAYTALQSLVERYGCIVGYPDRTYRGLRAMTRYEFASGLNACLNKITDLIGEGTNILQEDLATLQRLQAEFEQELAGLSLKIENLEARTAFLEDHQFSTTTTLSGSISFAGTAYASAGEGTREAVLQHQSYLQFSTSFTGRDLLSLGAVASTSVIPQLASFNDGRNVGFTNEGFTVWAYGGSTGSDQFLVGSIEYIFPIINDEINRWYMTISLENGFNTSRFLLPILSPLTWEGYELNRGPISAFGQRNPLYRLGGTTGFITNYDRGPWRFSAGYFGTQAEDPSPGNGFFNGDYLALAQLNYTPSGRFALAMIYYNNYFGPGRFAFNNSYKFDQNTPGYVGTALANRFDNAGVFFDEDVPVISNTYGVQTFYKINPRFVLGGFVAKIDARLMGRGDADIWTYALSASFPDLFKEGSVGGLIVGVEPMLTGITGEDIPDFKRDTSVHIEAFYEYLVNDNLSITPGVIWITSPNQDSNNDDIVLGVIRTTFSF
ncbi:Carbohydrate-selective porin OprB [Gloeothece citriformis PCC 7424]|uniref:Carbohydrate-selective porin OprB n=1 Tax=Gloeothece citriformis (strain PCC 7424) TaxID=65393 RepID=B7KBT7_GLOC7|nr:iron uptake porin [Gloeothece citriformis]ACK73065.1 Carbohydrate-selective porin OprB [Gloeothece citriformis PCC 7424]